jgi:hypothetical protein
MDLCCPKVGMLWIFCNVQGWQSANQLVLLCQPLKSHLHMLEVYSDHMMRLITEA